MRAVLAALALAFTFGLATSWLQSEARAPGTASAPGAAPVQKQLRVRAQGSHVFGCPPVAGAKRVIGINARGEVNGAWATVTPEATR